MLKFDIDKLKFSGQHASTYGVYYKLWKVDDNYTIESINNMKNLTKLACYSGLFSLYNNCSDEGINGICIMNHIKPTSVKLEYDEIDRWIKLGVKYKMMPEYIKTDKCILIDKKNEDNFYFIASIMCEGVPQALLYLYLNTIRELYEDPGFVRSVLYLHETLGINYYAAYVFAAFFNKTGIGHNILPITKTSGIYSNNYSSCMAQLKSIELNNKDSKLDLNIVRALYRFVNDSTVDRGLPVLRKVKKGSRARGWSCIDKIMALTGNDKHVKFKMSIPVHKLDNKNLDTIISTTIEDAIKLLETIK